MKQKTQSEVTVNESRHTPGQYYIEGGNEDFDKILIWSAVDGKMEESKICEMNGNAPEDEANATRIVTAVNMHDQLLTSLHNCLTTLDAINDLCKTGIAFNTIKEGKETIAKATNSK